MEGWKGGERPHRYLHAHTIKLLLFIDFPPIHSILISIVWAVPQSWNSVLRPTFKCVHWVSKSKFVGCFCYVQGMGRKIAYNEWKKEKRRLPARRVKATKLKPSKNVSIFLVSSSTNFHQPNPATVAPACSPSSASEFNFKLAGIGKIFSQFA